MPENHTSRRRMTESQAALVLLLPFLATYALFLVYPFFRGIWISLHDWNLMAVAFNPDAKEFVGLHNYIRVMWGKNITWDVFIRPALQFIELLGIGASIFHRRIGWVCNVTAVALAIAAILPFVLPGFHPAEGGRWYDRRFWPTVGNTLIFVGFMVPGVVVSALLLAVALNREARAMSAFCTLFFLSQILSVTVVTLIWQIIFSPLRADCQHH